MEQKISQKEMSADEVFSINPPPCVSVQRGTTEATSSIVASPTSLQKNEISTLRADCLSMIDTVRILSHTDGELAREVSVLANEAVACGYTGYETKRRRRLVVPPSSRRGGSAGGTRRGTDVDADPWTLLAVETRCAVSPSTFRRFFAPMRGEKASPSVIVCGAVANFARPPYHQKCNYATSRPTNVFTCSTILRDYLKCARVCVCMIICLKFEEG